MKGKSNQRLKRILSFFSEYSVRHSREGGNDGVEGFAGIAECEAEKPAFWKSPKQNREEQPSQLTTESGFLFSDKAACTHLASHRLPSECRPTQSEGKKTFV